MFILTEVSYGVLFDFAPTQRIDRAELFISLRRGMTSWSAAASQSPSCPWMLTMTPVLSLLSSAIGGTRPFSHFVVADGLRVGDEVFGDEYKDLDVEARDRDELFGLRKRPIEGNIFLLLCELSPLSEETAEEGPDQLEGGVHIHFARGNSGAEVVENWVRCEATAVCVLIRDNERLLGACVRKGDDGASSSSLSDGTGRGSGPADLLLCERAEDL